MYLLVYLMKRMSESRFYDLLSLKLSGDATPEDLLLLQEALAIHPEWQHLYDRLFDLPVTAVKEKEFAGLAYASHFAKMQANQSFSGAAKAQNKKIPATAARNKVFQMLRYAAAISACFIVFFLIDAVSKSRNKSLTVAKNEVTTKKGSKFDIKLPDGTQVCLNADTKFSYSNDFVNNREVTLEGEAYFDVAHDAEHPFVIHTGNANIRVLGTAFNVRNYATDKTLETTLMRGKIEVSFNDRVGDKIILKPFEKMVFYKTGQEKNNQQKSHSIVELTKVGYADADSTIAETAWLKDKFVFIDEPLVDIADKLEKQYAIKIFFMDETVKTYRYTGVFGNVPIDKILQILQLSKKINYKIEGKVVTIF